MSAPLDRSLLSIKNECEELMHRISEMMRVVEVSDITSNEKSVFSNDFSKLANDIASLNESILNASTQDNVDLESYVVAPDRLSGIAVRIL